MSEICPNCGLPQEVCVCETIAKEGQIITITTVKKKFGKIHTLVEGVNSKEINIKELTTKLKSKLACGGTVKDNIIELQGDHRNKLKHIFIELGYAPEAVEVK